MNCPLRSMKVRTMIVLGLAPVLLTLNGADAAGTFQAIEYAVLTDARATLRSAPDGASAISHRFSSADFGRAMEIEAAKNGYLKVMLSSNKAGWIRDGRHIVLTNRTAKPGAAKRRIRCKQKVFRERRPGAAGKVRLVSTKIGRKVVVVNDLNGTPGQGVFVGLYDNPDLAGKPIAQVTIFELRYLYDETEASTDGRSAVLVGLRDDLTRRNAHKVLTGWIARGQTEEWSNRIGFEFNKKTFDKRAAAAGGPGKIFFKERHLIDYLNGGFQGRPIYTEQTTAEPLPYFANRFPVLDATSRTPDGNRIYQAAFIGSGLLNGAARVPAGTISGWRKKLSDIVNSREVQIAILVDATAGMQSVIDNVKRALDRFVAKELSHLRLKIAIAVYRDFPDRPNDPFWLISDFTNDWRSLSKKISAISAYSTEDDLSGDHAYPEAVFYGIDQAIRRLSWKSRYDRWMILVGDHGNHTQPTADFQARYPLAVNHLQTESVRRALQTAKIHFNAVQVHIASPGDKRRRHNRRFEEQFRAIAGTGRSFSNLVKAPSNTVDDYVLALERAVGAMVLSKWCLAAEVRRIGGCSDRSAAERDLGKRVLDIVGYHGTIAAQVLNEYADVDPKMFGANQISIRGHVSERDRLGNRQLELRVLVDKVMLTDFQTALKGLIESMINGGNASQTKEQVENALVGIVSTLTGDTPDPEDQFGQFISKRIGIPIKTGFLNRSIVEIVERTAERHPDYVATLKVLQRKRLLLDAILGERPIEIGAWDDEELRFQFSYPKRRPGTVETRWFFDFQQPLFERLKGRRADGDDGARSHVWLPMHVLP